MFTGRVICVQSHPDIKNPKSKFDGIYSGYYTLVVSLAVPNWRAFQLYNVLLFNYFLTILNYYLTIFNYFLTII